MTAKKTQAVPAAGTVVESSFYVVEGKVVPEVPPGQAGTVWVAAGHAVTDVDLRRLDPTDAYADPQPVVVDLGPT